ncbi:MAG: hypothetical protein JW885_10060 [Deltaproteobacteria bacterium]|nr:hypothetical protein [Candidatus Zymogenaceae bacterium]
MFPIDYIPAADTVGIVGGVMLLVTLLAAFLFVRARLGGKKKKEAKRRHGFVGSIIKGLLLLLFLTASLAILLFALLLRAHGTVDVRKPVAEVYCRDLSTDAGFDLDMEYTPAGGDAQKLLLRGDQWMVEGYIIDFDGRLTILGITSGYRIVRIRGRYTDPADEAAYPPTIYSTACERWDGLWRYLFEKGDRLPLVEAVYGAAVFTYPDEDDRFAVYITSNGFTLSRIE